MKRIVKTVSFILLLCFAFAGCSSISSEGDSSSPSQTVYSSLTQEQQQELDEYAISFAETFDVPFDSTDVLDQELIGQFSFWKIYEETGETNAAVSYTHLDVYKRQLLSQGWITRILASATEMAAIWLMGVGTP